MNPTGWQTRYDPDWPSADKWIASNLDTGEVVFGQTRAEVEAGYEGQRAPNARWIARTGSR